MTKERPKLGPSAIVNDPPRVIDLTTVEDGSSALGAAAMVALHAPSVHNTQPWHWRVATDRLELYADERWRLNMADPDGRLMVLSCGTALHHARTALRAMGYLPAVQRFPDPYKPRLLARVTIKKPIQETSHARAAMQAALRRQTDRRPFSSEPLSEAMASELQRAAASEGAWLHLLDPTQTETLLIAAERAEGVEYSEPEYREELAQWTGRPEHDSAGVPRSVISPRGRGYHETGTYAVLYGSGDRPSSWLRAGEALSAVWLTATVAGLALQPISAVIEVPAARAVLQRLLSGIGSPYLAMRIGVPVGEPPPVRTPRREMETTVDMDAARPREPATPPNPPTTP